MAYEIPGVVDGAYLAGADLSSAQFTGVTLNGSGQVVQQTTGGAQIIGILQNNPKTGQPATVMTTGISKAVAGAALATPGVALMMNTSGQVVAQTGTNATVGYLLDTASGAGIACTVQLAIH